MKKIIKGRLYDTETAKEKGQYKSPLGPRDFHYFAETLYQKRTGEFFLFGEGGPASKYSRRLDGNSWTGDSDIIPISYEEAREWAEKYLSPEAYEELFGLVPEDDSRTLIQLSLPASMVEGLRREAAKHGITVSAYAERVLGGFDTD